MRARGHDVEIWSPVAFFYRLPVAQHLKKWPGYIDQFLIFPQQVRTRLRRVKSDILFVFADQALGPWVPLVSSFPHVIHVHDFMALRSALGEFPQNPTTWTGRVYQHYIRNGFIKGKNFISISCKTQQDLTRLLGNTQPNISAVIYNGLNYPFTPLISDRAFQILVDSGLSVPREGFLMHVGGNQWYKNRLGVLSIYKAYCEQIPNPLPLWMIGGRPTSELLLESSSLDPKGKVIFLQGIDSEALNAAYTLSRALIFPSLAEGFGWPIAEAMACGCPVLTTGEAPMTEVAGDVATYIPPMPHGTGREEWAHNAAKSLLDLLGRDSVKAAEIRERSIRHAQSFTPEKALDAYEGVYRSIIDTARSP